MNIEEWEDLLVGEHITHTESRWEWVILDSKIESGVRKIKLKSVNKNPPITKINGPGPSAYSIWLDYRSAAMFEESRSDMLKMQDVYSEVFIPEPNIALK